MASPPGAGNWMGSPPGTGMGGEQPPWGIHRGVRIPPPEVGWGGRHPLWDGHGDGRVARPHIRENREGSTPYWVGMACRQSPRSRDGGWVGPLEHGQGMGIPPFGIGWEPGTREGRHFLGNAGWGGGPSLLGKGMGDGSTPLKADWWVGSPPGPEVWGGQSPECTGRVGGYPPHGCLGGCPAPLGWG